MSHRRGFEISEAVPVKYDPSNPGRARLDKRFRLWVSVVVLVLMSAGFVAAGVLIPWPAE